MVADSISGAAWLRWVTPLGWIEELQPLTKPRSLALVPIAAFTVVLGALAARLAGRRDLGSSVLGERESTKARLGLLHGSWSLAFRLARPSLLAWFVSIVALRPAAREHREGGRPSHHRSPTLRLVFERLGVSGATAYLGIVLVIMAVALTFIAASQASAARKEESTGQLDNLLVRAISRTSWLSGRILLATTALVVGGLVIGLSTWAGAASEHAGVGFITMLGAGLNTVAPALLLGGIGVLIFGVAPSSSELRRLRGAHLVVPRRTHRGHHELEPLDSRHLSVAPDGRRALGANQLDGEWCHGRRRGGLGGGRRRGLQRANVTGE